MLKEQVIQLESTLKMVRESLELQAAEFAFQRSQLQEEIDQLKSKEKELVEQLSKREQEIIEKHMWPLTPRPPRYAETYLVGLADKIAACLEMVRLYRPLGFGRRVCALAAQRAH